MPPLVQIRRRRRRDDNQQALPLVYPDYRSLVAVANLRTLTEAAHACNTILPLPTGPSRSLPCATALIC